MSKINFTVVLFMLFIMASCNKEMEIVEQTNIVENNDPSRKMFSSVEDYKAYFEQVKKDDGNVPLLRSTTEVDEEETIVERFLSTTAMGKIFNSKYEFQVGDTIVKLGMSGYSSYKICSRSYQAALKLIEDEQSLFKKIGEYRKVEQNMYEIGDGIFLYYSGDPLIETQKVDENVVKLRTTEMYGAKVEVSFWRTSNFFFNGCGIEMSYRKLVGRRYKKVKTNLRMTWFNVVITHIYKNDRYGAILRHRDGEKDDTGYYDKKTFFETVGFNIGGWKYYLMGGVLTGSAEHGGSWITDKIVWPR